MRTIITIILVLLSFKLIGQTSMENYMDCNETVFSVKAEEKPQFEFEGGDLIDYLNQAFEENHLLDSLNGSIILGILIFDNGKACCKSIRNITGKDLNLNEIKLVISNMPEWIPAKEGGVPVNFLYNLMTDLKDGKLIK